MSRPNDEVSDARCLVFVVQGNDGLRFSLVVVRRRSLIWFQVQVARCRSRCQLDEARLIAHECQWGGRKLLDPWSLYCG